MVWLGVLVEKEIFVEIKQMISSQDEVFFDAEEEDAPVQEQCKECPRGWCLWGRILRAGSGSSQRMEKI